MKRFICFLCIACFLVLFNSNALAEEQQGPEGTLKWSYTTGGGIYSSPAIGSDGTIYVGSIDKNLYALTPTGTVKWSYTTGDIAYTSPAIGSDGTIYVGDNGGKLYAISSTGTLKWSYTTGNQILSSPAVGSDGTIYVGSLDNKFYAITSAGTLKWSYIPPSGSNGAFRSSPAIGSDGTIYVGSWDSGLYALSPTGTLKWIHRTGNRVHSSPAIGSDGTIYVGSYDNKLYAVNSEGTLRWSYTTGGYVHSSPAIGSDGTIYVGSSDNKLYAISSTGILKWSYTTGGEVYSSPVIGSDGTIYVGSYDNKLYALTPTGILKWSYTTGSQVSSSPAIGSEGTIYIGSYDNNLYALTSSSTGGLASSPWPMFHHDNQHTGKSGTNNNVNQYPSITSTAITTGMVSVAYNYDVNGSDPDGDNLTYSLVIKPSGMSIDSISGIISWIPSTINNYDVTVQVSDGKGGSNQQSFTIGVFPPQGTLKWRYKTGNTIDSSPAIGSDGTIYIGSQDGKLYAITSTGTLKWSYTTGGQVRSSPAIGSDGTVYVGADDSKLYALTPEGTLKWSYTTENYIDSSPAIGSDGTIYVGAANKILYALTPTGSLKWSYATEGYIHSSPVIGSDDGTIYVGAEDNKLYAITSTGTLKWSYTARGQVRSSPAIGSDGTIYIGSQDGKFYALNPEGTLKWSYTAGKGIYSSPAIGSDGTIYVGSDDGKFYALNPEGTVKWSYSPGNVEFYSSPAIGSDGMIYIGCWNRILYALTPTGTVKWSYETGYPVSSSPTIGSDGTIYIGSYDNNLYALTSSSTGGLASSPWPMFHHDNQHTGKSGTITSPPSVPILFSPTDGGTGISKSPTLVWNKASGATSYTLQVSQSSNFSSFVINQAVTDTSKQISGLSNGITYYWRVSAFNPDRSSGWSNTWNFTTSIDGTPPAISDLNAGNAVMGQEKIITCTVTDNGAVKSVKLYYRQGGSTGDSSSFSPVIMVKQTGSTYSGTIPVSAITAKGIEFYIEATDNADNRKTAPEINPVRFPSVLQVTIGSSGITRSGTGLPDIPSGTTNNDFRMISFPLVLNDKNPLTVLGTALGSAAYDKTKWRLLQYSGNTLSEYPTVPTIQPGYAYWLIVKTANPAIKVTDGLSVPTDVNFTVTIPAGWSQIGNPFNFNVSWNSIRDSTGASNLEPRIWKWTGTSYSTTINELVPWEGYFIYNTTAGNVTLKIPPEEYTGTPKEGDFLKSINPDGWTVQIGAQAGNLEDSDNFAGVSKNASNEHDLLDFSEPPPIGDYVSLYFPHSDWKENARNYAGDFQPLENEGVTWDFVVESSLKEKVDLQFENLDSVPEDMKIKLIDMKSITIIDLRAENQYSFQPFIGGKKTDTTTSKFKLVIGNDSYIKQVMQDLPKLPEEYLLEQNFPNPFNPITTIRFALPKEGRVSITIYNILGQEVKTVFSEQLPAGIHEVIWDGTNNFGQPVASGMYLYCMRAGEKYVQTRKLVLLR